MAGRLKDKVAVVTGAARAARARKACDGADVAREGARCAVNRSASARQARPADQGRGRRGRVFAGDVAKADAAEAMAEFTIKKYGRLDILHNNVGIGAPARPRP